MHSTLVQFAETLGYSPFFHQQFLALVAETPRFSGWFPERVVIEQRGSYELFGPNGSRSAILAGRFSVAPIDEARPCVGDFVLAEPGPGGGLTRIEHVFERKNLFRRKAALVSDAQSIAANIDLCVVVSAFASSTADDQAIEHGLNLRRIERYLHAIAETRARAVVAISKADLRPDADEQARYVSSALDHADVIAVSAHTGQGLEALAQRIGPAMTAVLAGSSGAGKSSLTNRLLGHSVQRVEAVREEDARGRHTTTHRELFTLPSGGLLIDTPGMREFGLFADESKSTALTGFADVDRLAERCRFRDCRHEDEPGCAVFEAVERGEIPASRVHHAHKLRRELERQRQRHQAQQRRAERRQNRASGRDQRRRGQTDE